MKYKIVNNVIKESYVEFVVTPEMAAANPGMTAGTYTLKGLAGDETGLVEKPIYEANKAVMLNAFGTSYCTNYATAFHCQVSGFYAFASMEGGISVVDNGRGCGISVADGSSYCV